jgi:hypothetical protein
VVGLGVCAKNNLAKRFKFTIIYLYVSGIPVTKTRSAKIQLISATRTSSLNLENSLKSEVRFPSSKETLKECGHPET